ncbi:MAG: hypothetical protein MPK62_07185 [Alphaproteobacteria bacterium]|nr:hypothetical protein [Alphaproteobacteria bacterium]
MGARRQVLRGVISAPYRGSKKIAKILAIVGKKLENACSRKTWLHELFRRSFRGLMVAKIRVKQSSTFQNKIEVTIHE